MLILVVTFLLCSYVTHIYVMLGGDGAPVERVAPLDVAYRPSTHVKPTSEGTYLPHGRGTARKGPTVHSETFGRLLHAIEQSVFRNTCLLHVRPLLGWRQS